MCSIEYPHIIGLRWRAPRGQLPDTGPTMIDRVYGHCALIMSRAVIRSTACAYGMLSATVCQHMDLGHYIYCLQLKLVVRRMIITAQLHARIMLRASCRFIPYGLLRSVYHMFTTYGNMNLAARALPSASDTSTVMARFECTNLPWY